MSDREELWTALLEGVAISVLILAIVIGLPLAAVI